MLRLFEVATRRGRRLVAWLAIGLGILSASAQETPRKDGLFITVPNPIKADTHELVRRKIADAVQRQQRKLSTIVFDFNPDELPSGTSSFGVSLDLAKFIRRLQLGGEPELPRLTTVAYVHKAVTRHSVLPVVACSEIVFSSDGSLGDVPREEAQEAEVRTAYREQAKYHPSQDVILRLLDPTLALKRVKMLTGEERIASEATLAGWKKDGKDYVVVNDNRRLPEPGRSLIDAETAREIGLAQAIYESRGELVEALGLSRRSLTEDWLIDRTPVPWRLEVRGPLDGGKVQSLERRIKAAVGRNANFIILQLESEAGDIRHVGALASQLRTLKDNTGVHPVRTVAYVPPGKTLGAATFLALGCSEIVLGKDAVLADFRYLKDEDRALVRDMIVPLAKSQGYPPLLFQATAQPDLTLVRVKPRAEGGASTQLVTEPEFTADQRSATPRWNAFGRILPADGHLLRIASDLAREWQIVAAGDLDTLDALYNYLGLDADHVRVSRDDYLDRVAEFFREPWVNFILIMLGVIGLILEIKMPGTTIPGTVAAICFVLFFWAYSFVGEFTLLAVFLFLLGLIMIAVEIFIVPGFTFVGLTGIVLVLASLGLVTLDRWPTTSQDWVNLGGTLTTFGFSVVAAVIGAITLAYYLPSLPYANRLVLRPPTDLPEGEVTSSYPSVPARLLGAVGVSVTTLRPAGKAQFGDDFLDVIAEGDFVEPGKRVQIVEIEGNRIVVKEV